MFSAGDVLHLHVWSNVLRRDCMMPKPPVLQARLSLEDQLARSICMLQDQDAHPGSCAEAQLRGPHSHDLCSHPG